MLILQTNCVLEAMKVYGKMLLLMKITLSFSTGFSGNNRLGGQDFNQRLVEYILEKIKGQFKKLLVHKEDLQVLRMKVEEAKLNLTYHNTASISIQLQSFNNSPFKETITRGLFEKINSDLFLRILKPIDTVLQATELSPEEVDEIVLVGGSTRIPRVISLVEEHMKRRPNTNVDPELAVVTGVSVQAGILGGMWPLTVSAVELPTRVKKIHIH